MLRMKNIVSISYRITLSTIIQTRVTSAVVLAAGFRVAVKVLSAVML